MKDKRVISAILFLVVILSLLAPTEVIAFQRGKQYERGPWKNSKAFYDGRWQVYIDGKSRGSSHAFATPYANNDNYNMVDSSELRSWAQKMRGNPSFVDRMAKRYYVQSKDKTHGKDMIWIRNIADNSGAKVDWDSSKKRVYIETSDWPEGYIDRSDEVNANDEVDISISGNFFAGKSMRWELSVDGDFVDDGTTRRKLSKTIPYTFDRSCTIELRLTDDYERTTVVKEKVKVKGGGNSEVVARFDIPRKAQVGERVFAEDQSYTTRGRIVDWYWEIDGFDASLNSKSDFEQVDEGAYFTFHKTGRYKIRLTVTTNKGKSSSTQKSIKIVSGSGGGNPDDGKTEPEVSLEINRNKFLRGETAQFKAKINPNDFEITRKSWDIFNPETGKVIKTGEGTIPESMVLDIPEGTYRAGQYAYFRKNGIEQEKLSTVKFEVIKPEPLVADFIADPWEQFVRKNIKLINKSKGYTEEEWYIRKSGIGSFEKLSLDSDNRFTRNEEGIYDVKLIVKNGFGRQAEKVKQVRFKPKLRLTIDFEAVPYKTQIGNNIRLINKSTGYTKENWFIKKANSSTWENLYLPKEKTFTRIDVGIYDVKLTVGNGIEEKSLVKQVEFTERSNLKAITYGVPPSAYVGQPIRIENGSFGEYVDYQWYMDGRKVDWPKSGTVITEHIPTTKHIKLEIWDEHGNTDSATTTVVWGDVNLNARISASKTQAIEGDTVYISNHSTGDYDDWTWKVNGQTRTWGKDGGMIIAEEGSTTVSLTIRHSETGKTDTDTVIITAEKPNIPPKAVIIAPDYVIRGERINIKDLSYDTDGKIVDRQWKVTGADKYEADLKSNGDGGNIVVDEFTTITVKLTVTDDDGEKDTDIKQIIVGGNEPPEIKLKESGTKKQNRKYSIDLSESITGGYYEIDWDKTTYDITPISKEIEQDSIKYIKREKGIDLLFKKPGTYKIKATIEDTGKRCDSQELEVVIAPDEPPVNNVLLQNANVYRDEPVKIVKEIYSPDDDIIKVEDIKIYYDSNNDGNFDNEVGKDISDKKILTFDKVGKYKIVSFVKEEFGQETIEEFVTEDDRKSTMFETIIKVDNRPPTAEIKADIPSKKEKVDLLILADSKLDNGSKYYYTKTNKDLPNRNYIKNNLTEISNKLAVRNINPKVFKKDLKTDVYEKDISENRKYHYYNKNDDNLPEAVKYSDKQGYNGTLYRQPGVTWTTKYANVSMDFTKYRYKNNYSRNDRIFEGDYYVNKDKNVLVNPETGYRKNVRFSGNIPREDVSWSRRYNYYHRDVEETEVKNNKTKDSSIFDRRKWYSQGGYSGYLDRVGLEWDENKKEKYIDVEKGTGRISVKHFKDSSKAPSSTNAPYSIYKDGQMWKLSDSNSKIYLNNIRWEGPIGSKPGTAYYVWCSNSTVNLETYNPDSPGQTLLEDIGGPSAQYVPGTAVWNGRLREGEFYTRNGGPYKYKRSAKCKYIIDFYRAYPTYKGFVKYYSIKDYTGTATYKGTVTKSVFSHYAGTAKYQGSLSATTTDGYHGEANYQGTAYKYVPDRSETEWRLASQKYVLYVADDNGANNLDKLKEYQQKTGAKVIFIGNSSYGGAAKNIKYTDLKKNIEEAIEFIAVEEELESRNAVLINEEEFVLETEESDPEQDKIVEKKFKYAHDPNFYMNPEGISKLPNNWTDYKATYLDKPGKYIVSYRVKDQVTEDLRFEDYNKYSNIAQIILFGHRRPIVTDFNINFSYNPSTKKYEDPVFMVEAYDPDYYDINTRKGRSDKGIVEYAYKWKKKGENEYKYGVPKVLNSGTYKFQVLARDIDDAWSLPFEKEITLTDVGFILKGILEPEEGKFSLSKIPASEELKVTNIETIHAYTVDSVEFSLYKGSSSKTPKRILEYPQDVKIKDKSYTQWTQIRAYQIPETLPDGNYLAILTGKSPYASASKRWNINIVTPVELVPNVPAELYIDENNRIKATTSKYVKRVTFKFNNKNYNMSLVKTIGDKKEWQYDIFLQEGFPLGKYDVTITATTPNGNQETKTVQVLVEDPLDIIGDSDKDVYRAGQAMLLSAETEGRASKVEAKMWYPKNEHTNENVTELIPNTTLTDPPQKLMTWRTRRTKEEGRDIVVIIPLKTPDGKYPIRFTAYKRRSDRGIKTATHIIYIRVKGTVYDKSKSQIIGPIK